MDGIVKLFYFVFQSTFNVNKTFRIIIIVFFLLFSGFIILLFSLLGQVNDHSVLNINTIITTESILFVLLISHIIYNGFKAQSVNFYFSFLIANLVFMSAVYYETPVMTRNVGFHHVNIVPTQSPLIINLGFYIALLLYLNVSFREDKITSSKFSRIIYAVAIVAISITAIIKINAETEYQEMLHFQG